MGENESSTVPKKWLWGCVSILALCAALTYIQWFFWGYVPLSTLPVEVYSEKNLPIDRICPKRPSPLPLPYYSPDGKYYIDLDKSRYRNATVVNLFESSNHQLLGYYTYYYVVVYCWAQESNTVYLADYVPGSIFDIGPNLPPGTGIIEKKKVLVPCQSSLEDVSLLPRLYWEIRCGLPGSEYSPFAVRFPLVVMVAGLVAGVRILLWLWQRWGRAWWSGA